MSQSASTLRRRRPDLVAVFPFLAWPQRMSGGQLRADLLAGLTGALVVLPQGVAFATIAGMPPQYGLYASIVPTILAALFGSSWHLVAGPSTTASLVLFASLTAFAPVGTPHYVELAITLAAMAGVMELALGVFRLGALVNFISHTVVVGYTAGVGILIMTTQARNFFGLQVPHTSEFWLALSSSVMALPKLDFHETIVATVTVVVGLASRRLTSKLPYMIPAILAGSFVGVIVNAFAPGSVATVGALPRSLPAAVGAEFRPRGLDHVAADRARHRRLGPERSGVDRPSTGDSLGAAARHQPGVHRPGRREPDRLVLFRLRRLGVVQPQRAQLRIGRALPDVGDFRRSNTCRGNHFRCSSRRLPAESSDGRFARARGVEF